MQLSVAWLSRLRYAWTSESLGIPLGSEVVPFCGLYLESYKVIPKRKYKEPMSNPIP